MTANQGGIKYRIAIQSRSREKSRNLHSFRDFILKFFWSVFQALSKERKNNWCKNILNSIQTRLI